MENKEILDSWKEISSYLGRDIRTCFRWEKELGLPVHRIDSTSPRSKVFAYKSEIDRWLKEKTESKEIHKKPPLENRRLIIGLLTSFISLSVLFAFLYFAQIRPFGASNEIPSIAILPFKNVNTEPEEEYFSIGITDEIIDRLTMLNNLKVISAISAPKYRNSDLSAGEIGEELAVDYVLKGIVEKTDEKINIGAQLLRIKDETEIWGEEYEEELKNCYYINDNIITNICEILNLNIAQDHPALSSAGRTLDYEAYDTYSKGKFLLNNLNRGDDNKDPLVLYHQGKYYWGKSNKENNEEAITLFEDAIEIDSNFALAYIGLARCYSNFLNFGWDKDERWLEQAEKLVLKAQEISPDLPEYYSTLAEIYLLKEFLLDLNTKDIAFDLAQEGIEKYPGHSQLNSIIGYCYYLKYGESGNEADFKKALEYKEKSFWLNPNSIHNIVYAEFLMLDREYYRAITICNLIKKTVSAPLIDFRLAEIHYYMGDLITSEAIFNQLEIPVSLKIGSKFFLGMIASQKGDEGKVLNIVGEINLLSPARSKFGAEHLKLASIYFGLGQEETGYKFLQSFFDEDIATRYPYIYIRQINNDKNFDRVKGDKEFKKIIKGGHEWLEAKQSE